MATQAERRSRTRAAIVRAATTHFSERGFAATSIADILETAGVSRGALYHHFSGKEEVFAAVYSAVSAEAVQNAGRAGARAESRLDALVAACLAWIDITARAEVAQILFVEGPKALGWDRCRALEEAASLGRVRAGLTLAARAGEIRSADLDLTARVLNAGLAEAALSIHGGQSGSTRTAARRTITALISGLRPPAEPAATQSAEGAPAGRSAT